MEAAFLLCYFSEGGVTWTDIAGRPMTADERLWFLKRLEKQKTLEAERLRRAAKGK